MTWLLVDAPNLLHRAFHACGPMTYKDMPTGALYGFFRDVLSLRRRFRTDDVVFAFDQGESLRKGVWTGYKAKRRKGRAGSNYWESAASRELGQQVGRLMWEILPRCLGYPNVLHAEGYEADDVIAAHVGEAAADGGAVVVSGDRDMYQLLSDDVSVWRPGRADKGGGGHYDSRDFRRDNGFGPGRWPLFKALSGDASDGIPGLPGVGEVSARAYLRGRPVTLKKARRNLLEPTEEIAALRERNLALVTLPFPGCPVFPLRKRVPPCPDKAWREVLGLMGIKTLEV